MNDLLKNNSAGTPQDAGAATSDGRRQNDPFPDLKIVWVGVDEIEEAPRRVRRAMKSQQNAVTRSIERFGNRIPILITRGTGREHYVVIDGHIRLAAARLLGADRVPCIVVDDLPEVEVRRLALSLNKLQETGGWDLETLRLEISEIIEIDGDLEFPGFELPEIEALQFGADAEADPGDAIEAPDPDAPAVSQVGDVFHLGPHILVCGSAREGAVAEAVPDGQVVSAVFTDPPYNVPINGHVRSASGGFAEFAEASGEMSRTAFVAFLSETIGSSAQALKPGGVLFICMDWRHIGELTEVLEALGLALLNICVWVKANPGMGSLYRSQHELIFVARKPGGPHRNNVELGRHGRNRSNVWHYAGATGGQADADDDFGVHPTVKPIRLVMDALLDVTRPGDLILDPFLGSGTTLLAAERTGRRCVGVEIEPIYVDVAIRRWQAMTGGTARHAESGASFDDLARERGADPAPGGVGLAGPATAAAGSSAPIPEDF